MKSPSYSGTPHRISWLVLLLIVGGALSLIAQIRTPTPVPGSPPIGRSPGDNTGGMERPSKSKKSKKGTPKEELPTITAEGFTIKNDGKEIVIHTADGRWITMTIDGETKWTRNGASVGPEQVIPGTTVKTEAAEDGEAYLTALTVDLEKDASAAEKADAAAKPAMEAQPDDAQIAESKKPIDVPDAPDRPKMMRGHIQSGVHHVSQADEDTKADDQPKEKEKSKDDQQQDFTIGSTAPIRNASKGGPGSDVLQRSMAWAENFDQGLPNYLCREVITRYAQQTRSEDWTPQDVVTANIVYQDGREQQRDIMVGNKKVSDITKTGGSWSTGEFATMLHSVFQPTRETDFKYYRSSMIHDVETTIFDFNVALPNSDWSIITGGQLLRPRYSGSIWIEKSTGVVRRLEQEAKNIPKDFPMDEVQSAIEYEEVSLGTQKFLLPVRAENIACQRSSSVCTKNVIEFRDYHKFAGESTIVFK